MHIFLTGPLQSGKSTAIARYLVGRPEAPGGFRTHWDRAGGRLTLELLETGETLSVATMEPHGVRADRAAFDAAGERLLSAPAGRRSLLLMDELGFLENDAHRFQAAVLAALDGSTPVLAAVKPKDTDFLRRVRQHPHGEVFNITPESREALYHRLRSRILQWNKEEL